MIYKILFNIIITTICLFNTNTNASVNDNITNKEFNMLNDISLSIDRMDLISQTHDNTSSISLYSNDNIILRDNKYIKLQIQESTNNDVTINNNRNKELKNHKINKDTINIDHNKNDIIVTINKSKLKSNNSSKNLKDNNESKLKNDINNKINISQSNKKW